jgi:hypothetical protein
LFTVATWITGIYLVVAAVATILNFSGVDRWLLGLHPDIPSNAVGDTLGGTFAPLAFLWFFISTWLQRTELEETRRVLAEQGREMEKTAQESAKQTRIMQSRAVYDEHSQRLYYLESYLGEMAKIFPWT